LEQNNMTISKILLSKCLSGAALAISLTLAPMPVMAQDEAPQNSEESFTEAIDAIFKDAFPVDDEPIDPAQLELGEQVAMRILPAGSYRRIMGETFQQMMGPIRDSFANLPVVQIAQIAGVPQEDISIQDNATIGELTAIIDPYFEQRQSAILGLISEILIGVMDEAEPGVRKGLARAYARRFAASEMNEMLAFFETDTGAKFAQESMAIYASKEVLAASAELAPSIFEKMAGIEEQITKRLADLPPERSFSDLSTEERARLAELLGVDADELGQTTQEEEEY
jgi:hypothetical protein